MKSTKYIDFNDEKLSLGKRKVAFVKWAMMKGTEKIKAQKIANKKFGWETRCAGCGKMVNVKILYCPNCGLKD